MFIAQVAHEASSMRKYLEQLREPSQSISLNKISSLSPILFFVFFFFFFGEIRSYNVIPFKHISQFRKQVSQKSFQHNTFLTRVHGLQFVLIKTRDVLSLQFQSCSDQFSFWGPGLLHKSQFLREFKFLQFGCKNNEKREFNSNHSYNKVKARLFCNISRNWDTYGTEKKHT